VEQKEQVSPDTYTYIWHGATCGSSIGVSLLTCFPGGSVLWVRLWGRVGVGDTAAPLSDATAPIPFLGGSSEHRTLLGPASLEAVALLCKCFVICLVNNGGGSVA
jgi:hypothetical protein